MIAIEDIEERIARTEALSQRVTAQITGMPKGEGPHDPVYKTVEMLDELNRRRLDKVRQYAELAWEVERAFDDLDERHGQIMRLYYIDGLTWAEVAERVCYDERQCYRLRDEALSFLGIGDRVSECQSGS